VSRPLSEKIGSTKLHQSWYILLGATALLICGKIPPDVWAAAVGISQGIYALANVQQHRIYGQPVEPPIGEVVDAP